MESIPAVRVSSAKARGNAKKYSYWGAARYSLKLKSDGWHAIAEEAASSDRRSVRLAEEDAKRLAKAEGRVYIGTLRGKLSAEEMAWIDGLPDHVRLAVVLTQ